MSETQHLLTGPLWRERPGAAGLLMTATLRPPMSAVARFDPQLRMNDYLEALRFYLAQPDEVIDRILFVENSATPLEPLLALVAGMSHGKKVEFIGFEGNDHPPERGKAFGEFRLIDHGLARTTLFGPEDLIWKTTGRLKLLNLPALQAVPRLRGADLICDLHNILFIGSRSLAQRCHMDLRVFGFRPRAYDAVLRGAWQRIGQGFDAASVYQLVAAARRDRRDVRVLPRFPQQLQIQGISGRHGHDYQSSAQVGKDRVRAVLRRIAPWVWL